MTHDLRIVERLVVPLLSLSLANLLALGQTCDQPLSADGLGAPESPPGGESFGLSLKIDGTRAVIGAPTWSISSWRGNVFLFDFDGDDWVWSGYDYRTELNDLLNFQSLLGYSVAVSGDILAFGAIGDDDIAESAGAVYVYDPPTTLRFEIRPSTLVAYAHFGYSVDVNGDRLVAGAPCEGCDPSVSAGAAHVFARNQDGTDQWGEMQGSPLSPTMGSEDFGSAVAILGDVILVGAPASNVVIEQSAVDDAGEVFVFRFDNGSWGAASTLAASDGQEGGSFGSSVALAYDGQDMLAVIGASGIHASEPFLPGSAYIFRSSDDGESWTQDAILESCQPTAGHRFGNSVSTDGDVVLVGESEDVEGSTHAYRRLSSHWAHIARLRLLNAQSGDRFGSAVAIWGDNSLIGAPYAGSGGEIAPFRGCRTSRHRVQVMLTATVVSGSTTSWICWLLGARIPGTPPISTATATWTLTTFWSCWRIGGRVTSSSLLKAL